MIDTGQMAVSGTVPLFTVPPGAVSIALAVVSGTVPVFVGPGTAVSTTNGFPVTTAPFAVRSFAPSAGEKIYATNGSTSSTVSVSWMISTGA